MSVLVVGISHKTAPVSLLERLAMDQGGLVKLMTETAESSHVTEATVIATCNRLEIYADVDRFHGSVEAVSQLLVDRAQVRSEELIPHLYVHYDDGAVSHLFHVVSGLDSIVLGEGQILGQARDALRVGQELGTVGPALNSLFQQALRVGKRAHAETDIDGVTPSLVTAALARSSSDATAAASAVEGQRVLVVGAGSMAGLATATVSRLGAAEIAVVNRSFDRAERLAREYAARAVPLTALAEEVIEADVVIACAGAAGVLVSTDKVKAAMRQRPDRPLTLIDLALPHDIERSAALVPGVTLVDLTALAEAGPQDGAADHVAGVRAIVAEEIVAFVAARRQASVTPTVRALRTMATGVVEAEIARLAARLPDLDDAVRDEVLHTVRRVADKLLHQPTVRVKELADTEGAVSYAAALAELFSLDPDAVDAVTRADVQGTES